MTFAVMEPEIIFEDHYLLVINKPSGMASEGNLESAEMWAYDHVCRQVRQKNNFLQLMHRLDKPASGILVLAKTKKAALFIQQQIEQRALIKKYRCLVPGDARSLSGKIEHFLARDEKGYKSMVVTADYPRAQLAVLEVLSVDYMEQNNQSLIHVQLHTGRYHQIRCQLSFLGFPVMGDGLYAPNLWEDYRHIALHAESLELEHPKTREGMVLEAKPEGRLW